MEFYPTLKKNEILPYVLTWANLEEIMLSERRQLQNNKLKMVESESCSVVSDSLQPHDLYSPWNSPGQNNGVGSHSLLQGIFPTQGSNLGLLHCWQILYHLSYEGSPGSQYSWVLMRALFLACKWTNGFNHVFMLWGDRSLSSSPYKATNPIKKPCFITQSNPNYPLKVSPLNIITWRASTWRHG